jgi:hypothetical protein
MNDRYGLVSQRSDMMTRVAKAATIKNPAMKAAESLVEARYTN